MTEVARPCQQGFGGDEFDRAGQFGVERLATLHGARRKAASAPRLEAPERGPTSWLEHRIKWRRQLAVFERCRAWAVERLDVRLFQEEKI